MSAWPTLSLPEWTVLAVVSEGPTHGFAIAQLTAPGGELGRIWHIPRPVIYRSIGRLLELALLDRAGGDPTGLLERQKATLEPIADAINAESPAPAGFDATVLAWRRATTAATMNFLDDLTRATWRAGSR